MPFIFEVKVIPSSGKQKIVFDNKSGILKCYLKNPPEKNLANNELIKFVAKMLKISTDKVEIIKGLSARKKTLRIDKNINLDELLKYFEVDIQMNFLKKD